MADIRKELDELMLGEYDFEKIYRWAKNFMAQYLMPHEMWEFVRWIKDHAAPLRPNVDFAKTIDLSSTGGDTIKTVNVGTISSFVLAAGGLVVGKQSTRSYRGLVGSRDFLHALGIEVPRENADPKQFERLLETHGLAFYYHPAFSQNFQNQIRFGTELKERDLGFVTPWHLLFWLYNPLPLSYRIYGMFTDQYLADVASIYLSLGIKRGLVVHGVGGIDEISTIGPTKVAELRAETIHLYELAPEDFGVDTARAENLEVSETDEVIRDGARVLYGLEKGPKRDLVLVNAGAAFHVAGIAKDWKAGAELARSILESGKARGKLEAYVKDAGNFDAWEALKRRAEIA